MTAQKRKFYKQNLPRPLLESFSVLFYLCKFFGINSQDFQEFKKYKQLKRSPTGEAYVVVAMIFVFINFNLMIGLFESSSYIEEKNTLSLTIGFVLTYFSIFAYLCDRFIGLMKQQSFENIFHDLEELDEDFMDFNITFDNTIIKHRILMNIVVSALIEAIIFGFTFTLLVEEKNWTAWLWIFTAIPTFFNTLDKIWYVAILFAIYARFEAINNELERIASIFEKQRKKEYNIKSKQSKDKWQKKYFVKNKIKPVIPANNRVFGDIVSNPQIFSIPLSSASSSSSSASLPPTATTFCKMEEKFIKLCQLHDGLCSVGKQLNDIWSFPNFILMGYGFFIIIAQFYFLYCSQALQTIPSLFRPAQNFLITAIYLFYVASKCVNILWLSLQTTLESKKTGICLHRCSLAADKDEIYEMINHFSLKLFNHMLDFNACGYFPLNMTTLFSFCGGITTYLIILIQFNIEEQQVVITKSENKPMALIFNATLTGIVGNVVNSTTYQNSTSLLNLIYKHYFKNFY